MTTDGEHLASVTVNPHIAEAASFVVSDPRFHHPAVVDLFGQIHDHLEANPGDDDFLPVVAVKVSPEMYAHAVWVTQRHALQHYLIIGLWWEIKNSRQKEAANA